WKAIELQHDRWIKGSDIAMPDVARHAREKNVGVTAFEPAHHRHLRNGVASPEIFGQKEGIAARGVAPHEDVLLVIGENLRLDEVTRAEQFGYGTGLTHRTQRPLTKALFLTKVGSLQLSSRKRGQLFAVAKAEVFRHVEPFEPGQCAHAHVVELREQECIDKVAPIDRELRIIDCFLRDLE